MDVHDLMEAAEALTKENQKKKAGEASAAEDEQAEMQDAATKSAYDANGKRRRRKKGATQSGAIGLSDDEDTLETPSKKAKEAITVRDYALATKKDHETVLEECMLGNVPTGYTCAYI